MVPTELLQIAELQFFHTSDETAEACTSACAISAGGPLSDIKYCHLVRCREWHSHSPSVIINFLMSFFFSPLYSAGERVMEILRQFNQEGSFLKRALRVSPGLAGNGACLALNSISLNVLPGLQLCSRPTGAL